MTERKDLECEAARPALVNKSSSANNLAGLWEQACWQHAARAMRRMAPRVAAFRHAQGCPCQRPCSLHCASSCPHATGPFSMLQCSLWEGTDKPSQVQRPGQAADLVSKLWEMHAATPCKRFMSGGQSSGPSASP